MEHTLKHIKEGWFIILFIGSIIVSWTMFSARLLRAEEKIAQHEIVFQQLEQIKIDIGIIRNDLDWIKIKIK